MPKKETRASKPAQPAPAKPAATGSKTGLIVLIIVLVVVVFGGFACVCTMTVFRPFMGWWWPRTPSDSYIPTEVVATATPTQSPSFGQQDANVYAQTALQGYITSLINQDVNSALGFCSASFKGSEFMAAQKMGQDYVWNKYSIGTPVKTAAGYEIPFSVTTVPKSGSGPTSNYNYTAEMINENGWVVDSLR